MLEGSDKQVTEETNDEVESNCSHTSAISQHSRKQVQVMHLNTDKLGNISIFHDLHNIEM